MKVKVNNYEGLVEKLTDMIIDLDVENAPFQVDVYLYVDEEGDWSLDEFINVGGNSWRNDDHITVYSYKGGYDSYEGDMTDEEKKDFLVSEYLCDYRELVYNALDRKGIEQEG